MCGNSKNSFFEISAVSRNLLVTDSILIGGQRTAVSKIMAYKQQWILTYWVQPMQYFTPRLARIATGGAPPPSRPAITYGSTGYQRSYPAQTSSDSGCCTIL